MVMGFPMSYCKYFSLILIAAVAWGQTTPSSNPESISHLQVIHADVPWYPPVAWTLRLTGTIEIHLVVNKGVITTAEVKSVVLGPTRDPLNEEGKKKMALYLSNPTLANVKTWQFQEEDSGTLSVRYVYTIEGEQTALPENPRVELELPLLVKVTARPFKPGCSDCGADVGGTPIR
jgi:hypothetical protein